MIIILILLVTFILFSFLSLFIKNNNKLNLINSLVLSISSFLGILISAVSIYQKYDYFKADFIYKYFYFDYYSYFFMLVLFIISFSIGIYSKDYLKKYAKPLNFFWFNFYLLIISMIGVLNSKNSFIFLFFWEAMAFSSFFLVMTEYEKKSVVNAGLIYLIANGIGALLLLIAFSIISDSNGNFQSIYLKNSFVYLLILLGFGLKAGFIPLHIWLPEAHPSAPANISAIMSGVMIKMGIYGIIRMNSLINSNDYLFIGKTILFIGIISAILGVLFALAQHEIKKLLAYSSIENIGIILIALGLSIILRSYGLYDLSLIAFLGALLHTLNHAVFKSLLFMSSGTIINTTHISNLEELGGLSKKMPFTSFSFLIGSAAISGLPFLNGFISEFMIYYAAFNAIKEGFYSFNIIAILSLAIVGTLALACFTKAYSAIFLGEPRTPIPHNIKEKKDNMILSMLILVLVCFIIGLFPYNSTQFLFSTFFPKFFNPLNYLDILKIFMYISGSYLFIFSFIAIFHLVKRAALKQSCVEYSNTWDCGYAMPSPKMQYGASSFVQPITEFFRFIINSKSDYPKINEYFPSKEYHFSTHPRAVFQEGIYKPIGDKLKKLSSRFSFVQSGSLRLYILYILIALVFLILWKI
jgi:formate hydrogenlyase subunit 3/multisubunit Na+/H+ antiporter MnhD subunit